MVIVGNELAYKARFLFVRNLHILPKTIKLIRQQHWDAFCLNIFGAMAEMEREVINECVKSGLE